jgi:hypothetical protein
MANFISGYAFGCAVTLLVMLAGYNWQEMKKGK